MRIDSDFDKLMSQIVFIENIMAAREIGLTDEDLQRYERVYSELNGWEDSEIVRVLLRESNILLSAGKDLLDIWDVQFESRHGYVAGE
jgi:hypothetical protein